MFNKKEDQNNDPKPDPTPPTPVPPDFPKFFDNKAGGKYGLYGVFERGRDDYTQGFYYLKDKKYFLQSTGQRGQSKIMYNEIKGTQFNTVKFSKMDDIYFGEGCEKIGNFIYQLTWQRKKIMVYDENLSKVKEVDFPINAFSEGWGITHKVNGGNPPTVYVSDGSYYIYDCSIDPDTHKFTVNKKLTVMDKNNQKYNSLNELEFVDGYIYANLYMNGNKIAKINSESGIVEKVFSLNELESFVQSDLQKRFQRTLYFGEVLNGIAYNSDEKMFYLTGKYWSLVFKVKFETEGRQEEIL